MKHGQVVDGGQHVGVISTEHPRLTAARISWLDTRRGRAVQRDRQACTANSPLVYKIIVKLTLSNLDLLLVELGQSHLGSPDTLALFLHFVSDERYREGRVNEREFGVRHGSIAELGAAGG